MARVLAADVDKCSGCRLCMLICSFVKEGEFNLAKSRIMVETRSNGFFSVQHCQRCEEFSCAAVCPEQAISRDPGLKATLIDRNLCTACRLCVDACEHNAVKLSGDAAFVCDQCNGAPACVRYCTYDCLEEAPVG